MKIKLLTTTLLLAFIALVGCDRKASPSTVAVVPALPSSSETLFENSFGRRQLEQMLEDRPVMKGVLPESHPAISWLIAGFNGHRHGRRVYWCNDVPQSGRPAECCHTYGPYPPHIAISPGSDSTPLDKWAAAVFEMNNLENTPGFERLTQRAMAGKLSAEEYADECVALEFVALNKTKEFFAQHPLETTRNPANVLHNWIRYDLDSFESYKKRFKVPGVTVATSNFEYFKKYFETTLAPLINANQGVAEISEF